jgi:hypothetical protein
MKNLLFICLIIYSVLGQSQNKIILSDFNGMYQNQDDKNQIIIFNNGNYIDSYITDKVLSFEYGVYGFRHSKEDISKIKSKNDLLTEISSNKNQTICFVPVKGIKICYYFDFEEILTFTSQNEFYFRKIKEYPKEKKKLIIKEYIKEGLDSINFPLKYPR